MAAGKAQAEDQKRPAHRPSRRQEILHAAIAVFARKGYVEANVDDIAREASVVPTAIYYHFGSKEELFHQALRAAMDGFSERVYEARPDIEEGDADALRRVVRSGWEWWSTHPDDSALLGRYSQGSTGHAVQLRAAWEERHLVRAYDYLPRGVRAARSGKAAREQHAVNSLRMRVLLEAIFACQAAGLEGGPLNTMSRGSVAKELEDVCVRLITFDDATLEDDDEQ